MVLVVVSCTSLPLVQPAGAQTEGTITDVLRQDSRLDRQRTVGNYLDVSAGSYATDNARRTEFHTVNDTVMWVGMSVDTARQGTRLDYAVSGDISYQKYADDIYKAEPYGLLDASATYAFVPERLDWSFRESFNRLLLDPTQSTTLSNVETYNYATTGPRLRLHLGSSTSLVVQATYSRLVSINSPNTVGADVDLDSARYGGNASLKYAVSERGELSLNLSSYRVRYANQSLNADFDRREATIGYHTRIARTLFAAEVGASRIEQTDDTRTGPLARIGVSRRISPSSTLELGFIRQTADAADIIRYDPGFLYDRGSPNNPSATWYESVEPLRVAARDPLVDTTATIGWRFERSRTRVGLQLYRARERYTVSTEFDRDVTGAYAHYERRLRRAWSLALAARFEGQTFTGNSRSDHEVDLSASLNWDVGRRLRVSFRGERLGQRGGAFNYDEDRIGVQLGYALL